MHCKYLPVVPYKALEKFSKALYGTTGRYLQCMRFPSCHENYKLIEIFTLHSNGMVDCMKIKNGSCI